MLLGSSNMASTGTDARIRSAENSTTLHNAPTSIKDLLWEDKCRTLRDLIVHCRLPLAVKLKSGDISKYVLESVANSSENKEESSTSNSKQASDCSSIGANNTKFSFTFDSTSANTDPERKIILRGSSGQDDIVLQIHEMVRRKIILARKMTWDKRQNEYVVTGEQVEIPASIKGWLEVIPEDGRPVEYFDTIGGIASVNPKRFLVRTSTVGYHLTTEENGNCCWMPHEIKPGQVLTMGIIYMDNKKNKSSPQRNIFKRLLKQNKAKKEHDLKYLQCFDSAGAEVMIPFIMSGVFSPVGDSSVANFDAVYEFQDLIMAFGLPVNAQLIQVNTKEKFKCPRGVLRLYGTQEEEHAIVSKVASDGILVSDTSKAETFEIPLDQEMLFSRGIVRTKAAVNLKNVTTNSASLLEQKIIQTTKPGEKDVKKKDDIRNGSVEGFKVRHIEDKKVTSPSSDKMKPVMASYFTGYSISFDAYKDDNRWKNGTLNSPTFKDNNNSKVDQLMTTETSESHSCNSTVSQEPDTHDIHASLSSQEPNTTELISYTDVELPGKAPKELRKLRSGSILDKLSVRKVKKERAKLKELRSDDVFSRRISRSDLSYQEFFNGIDNDDCEHRNSDGEKSRQDDSGRGSSGGTYQSSSSNNSNNVYSKNTPTTPLTTRVKSPTDTNNVSQPRTSIQRRDLPPIPSNLSSDSVPASPTHSMNLSKESLYEHLPPAPQPPSHRRASESALLDNKYCDHVLSHKGDEDGYMMPVQIQQECRYVKRSEVQLRQRTKGLANDSLSTRARKVRSELPREFIQRTKVYGEGYPLDIDNLFGFTYDSEEFETNHPPGTLAGSAAVSTSQLYAAPNVPAWKSNLNGNTANPDERFVDNLDLEITRIGHDLPYKFRHQKSMNINPNATLRSYNLRKIRPNAKEIFPFAASSFDSQSALQDCQNDHMKHSSIQQNIYSHNTRPQLHSSRSVDAALIMQQYQHLHNIYGTGCPMQYAESEPCFRLNMHSVSSGGTDTFTKQGDDSAISVCSRGEAGYLNESEFSYNTFRDKTGSSDDGWIPPDKIEELSVQEVSRSLRYIGMKDRVVLRFANEQIDGSMLCTLDKKLLKEGFPELNALELKKILDFVQGWRPKKT